MSESDYDPIENPEHFSLSAAAHALTGLFAALPKGKRMEYFGELNEISLTLQYAGEKLGKVAGSDGWGRSLVPDAKDGK